MSNTTQGVHMPSALSSAIVARMFSPDDLEKFMEDYVNAKHTGQGHRPELSEHDVEVISKYLRNELPANRAIKELGVKSFSPLYSRTTAYVVRLLTGETVFGRTAKTEAAALRRYLSAAA